VKQVTKAVGIQKKFMYIHSSNVCNSFARRWYGYYHAQRPLGHQNIELLPEPYFHVVLLYPIVLILDTSTQNSHTCLKRHGKRCNNLAKPKKFRNDSGLTHWGQQFDLHLHALYCIVPSGGINKEEQW
jgi:hypothetical protein